MNQWFMKGWSHDMFRKISKIFHHFGMINTQYQVESARISRIDPHKKALEHPRMLTCRGQKKVGFFPPDIS